MTRATKYFSFINTVSGNKYGYTQRQIKSAEVSRTLYAKLCYPSWKDFKLVIRSNQIKDCLVTVEDVYVALNLWVNNTAALKGKITRIKPNTVARDSVKITLDIFSVNKIPLFFTLSRKICFTAVNHILNCTVP